MITNLLAAITTCLVTNTTEKFPQHRVSDPVPMNADGSINAIYICHWENDSNPTNKTIIIEVLEVTTLKFEWAGEVRSVKSEKVLAHEEKLFVLDSTWKTTTNAPPERGFGFR